MLTKRLAACAELVSGIGIACDVGTDHAYLAAELLRSGKCSRVIASDVAEGPLEAARRTLEQAGLLDCADIILSDGLMQVPSEGISDVVIAGMGGETIVHILSQCSFIKENVNLILQPMTKHSVLREWLGGEGFDIIEEKIVHEGKFYYTVIKARYSGVMCELSDLEKEIGRLDLSDKTAAEFARFRLSHFQRLSSQMEKSAPEESAYYKRLAQELSEKLKGESETL